MPQVTQDRSGGRGYDASDRIIFATQALPRLQAAQNEIQFLLDHGYPLDAVISLVGSHHQLTARQRMALQRATGPGPLILRRKAAMLPWSAAADGPLYIDGFNLIITLEVALSGNVLIRGGDGALRDLAGLRGTYRVIPQTRLAISLLGETLIGLGVPAVQIDLDAPVSNSGRLRAALNAAAKDWGLSTDIRLVPNADRELSGQARIVSSDSLLLDRCQSWFNLAEFIIDEKIPDAWIIDLAGRYGSCS